MLDIIKDTAGIFRLNIREEIYDNELIYVISSSTKIIDYFDLVVIVNDSSNIQKICEDIGDCSLMMRKDDSLSSFIEAAQIKYKHMSADMIANLFTNFLITVDNFCDCLRGIANEL